MKAWTSGGRAVRGHHGGCSSSRSAFQTHHSAPVESLAFSQGAYVPCVSGLTSYAYSFSAYTMGIIHYFIKSKMASVERQHYFIHY